MNIDINKIARLIAFYLPQYHPIPENDEWWGKGFTEWTNVAKAKPLFKGHYQPHLPADLGFYDLRVPEVREAQAELAREAGIEGFCYWHYWFAGKQLLERPFNEVLASGKPDFPFCLAWANESWTGIWHGAKDKILMEQTYPGVEDHRNHFMKLERAFKDSRYICIEGKPVFVVFHPLQIPDLQLFVDTWQELALKAGLKGIYFLGMAVPGEDIGKYGFDGMTIDSFFYTKSMVNQKKMNKFTSLIMRMTKKDIKDYFRRILHRPYVYSYKDLVSVELPPIKADFDQFPCIFPNWDNTPRCGQEGYVLENSSPELFRIILHNAINQVNHYPPEKRLIIIKSWNEWAEGNYLEPDKKFGLGYLDVIKEMLGLI